MDLPLSALMHDAICGCSREWGFTMSECVCEREMEMEMERKRQDEM